MSLSDATSLEPANGRHRGDREDLDLTLGPSKAPTLSRSIGSNPAVAIVLEDDDDVQVSSSPSVAQNARTTGSSRQCCISVLDDEDLELRLGLAAPPPRRRRLPRHVSVGIPENDAIDLTSINDDGKDLTRIKKRKDARTETVHSKEFKLVCAVCLDSMKEETSTVCGHIFCKMCITRAIQIQRKCPTCRRKLKTNQIHPIYLSNSTC